MSRLIIFIFPRVFKQEEKYPVATIFTACRATNPLRSALGKGLQKQTGITFCNAISPYEIILTQLIAN